MTVDLDAAALLAELVDALERDPRLAARVREVLAAPVGADVERLYATPGQAAERFGVSKRTIFSWLRQGLPAIGSGRTRRIDVRSAERWLRERPEASEALERRARSSAAKARAR